MPTQPRTPRPAPTSNEVQVGVTMGDAQVDSPHPGRGAPRPRPRPHRMLAASKRSASQPQPQCPGRGAASNLGPGRRAARAEHCHRHAGLLAPRLSAPTLRLGLGRGRLARLIVPRRRSRAVAPTTGTDAPTGPAGRPARAIRGHRPATSDHRDHPRACRSGQESDAPGRCGGRPSGFDRNATNSATWSNGRSTHSRAIARWLPDTTSATTCSAEPSMSLRSGSGSAIPSHDPRDRLCRPAARP